MSKLSESKGLIMTDTLRAHCGRCGRYVATRVPAGGSGDYRVPWRHRNFEGEWCDGHHFGAQGWGWEHSMR